MIGGLLLLTSAVEIPAHNQPVSEPKIMQQFDPEQTRCRSMNLKGWKRVYPTNNRIPKGARLEWFETLKCKDFSQNPVNEFYMKEEWWRKKK